MSMSSVPCNSSIRFLYWSFSFIDVDTLLPLEVDRLLRFVQRSDQPCPLSRFKSTSVLRTKIGDSALALNPPNRVSSRRSSENVHWPDIAIRKRLVLSYRHFNTSRFISFYSPTG